MTIRLTPMINSPAIGKITSRAPRKEAIECDELEAVEKPLAKSVDTEKGNFDKAKAKSTEEIVYDEDDAEWEDMKKTKKFKEGVEMPMFREMMKNTERALKLTESPRSLTKNDFRQLVKEEYVKILDEQNKNNDKIAKKLNGLREDLIKEFFKRTSTMKQQTGVPPLYKSLQLKTVSELVEVPVNELMLFFLQTVKNSNTHHLVEYHLGHVFFYGN
jgi:hypothetical protein